MLDNLFRDLTGIVMAIVGVAILYTLVNPRNKTDRVISAASSGVATMLSAAMGAGTVGGGILGGN